MFLMVYAIPSWITNLPYMGKGLGYNFSDQCSNISIKLNKILQIIFKNGRKTEANSKNL